MVRQHSDGQVIRNNRINGASYDAAGNQLVVNGDTLSYDAENRQVRPPTGFQPAQRPQTPSNLRRIVELQTLFCVHL